MMTPVVSVIIPCYNFGKYLSSALDSLLDQSLTNWECIIVNDGSTDNTKEIAESYLKKDSRFVYISQENSGVSVARNTALKYATGKYLQPLDADDVLETDKLLLHSNYLDYHPEVDLVYSDIKLFSDEKDVELVIPPLFTKPRVSGKYAVVIDGLTDDNIFLPGCAMFKKEAYKKVGGFKPTYGFEDLEFFYRLAISGFEFKYHSPKGSLLHVRNHSNNATKNYRKMMLSKIIVRQEMLKETTQKAPDLIKKTGERYYSKLEKRQKDMLLLDESFYEIRYENLLAGITKLFLNIFHLQRKYFAIYETYHLLRARLKDKK